MTTQHFRKHLISVGFLAAALALPANVGAFYQTTVTEGTIGKDIGGVWLATFHVMPSFRVRVDSVEGTRAPWKVTPAGKDLVPLLGEDLRGVVISELLDPSVTGTYSIFVGDVITKINTNIIDTVEDYEKALEEVKEWFLVTLRRPQLKFTNVRLLKIKYDAREVEEDGVSSLGDETIEVRVLDNQLPFADDLEKARRARELYAVSDEQRKALAKNWYELPTPDMALFVSGEHRVVAEPDYDQSLRRDDNLRNTTFAIISQLKGNPLAGQAGQNIGVYGIRDVGPDKISGTYVESTLASAPFPISIDFNGAFTMTRLGDYSDKDVEVMLQRKSNGAPAEPDENVETAPDVPADIPAE